METVNHNGRKTAYRLVKPDAEGPTVLYIHGSGGTHRIWAHQYAPDGPSHPAIALDVSGHGASEDIETEPGQETLEAYAADVASVARQTGADVLVGNSMGGAILLEVILGEYYDPRGAVFAGSGAKLAVHERIRTLLREDFTEFVEFAHADDRLLYAPDEEALELSKASMQAVGQAVTRRDFLTCHEFDVRNRIANVEVPALAIVGEYDRLTPPSYHDYLAEELPSCRMETIENAAHLAMIDRPASFNAILEDFSETIATGA